MNTSQAFAIRLLYFVMVDGRRVLQYWRGTPHTHSSCDYSQMKSPKSQEISLYTHYALVGTGVQIPIIHMKRSPFIPNFSIVDYGVRYIESGINFKELSPPVDVRAARVRVLRCE